MASNGALPDNVPAQASSFTPSTPSLPSTTPLFGSSFSLPSSVTSGNAATASPIHPSSSIRSFLGHLRAGAATETSPPHRQGPLAHTFSSTAPSQPLTPSQQSRLSATLLQHQLQLQLQLQLQQQQQRQASVRSQPPSQNLWPGFGRSTPASSSLLQPQLEGLTPLSESPTKEDLRAWFQQLSLPPPSASVPAMTDSRTTKIGHPAAESQTAMQVLQSGALQTPQPLQSIPLQHSHRCSITSLDQITPIPDSVETSAGMDSEQDQATAGETSLTGVPVDAIAETSTAMEGKGGRKSSASSLNSLPTAAKDGSVSLASDTNSEGPRRRLTIAELFEVLAKQYGHDEERQARSIEALSRSLTSKRALDSKIAIESPSVQQRSKHIHALDVSPGAHIAPSTRPRNSSVSGVGGKRHIPKSGQLSRISTALGNSTAIKRSGRSDTDDSANEDARVKVGRASYAARRSTDAPNTVVERKARAAGVQGAEHVVYQSRRVSGPTSWQAPVKRPFSEGDQVVFWTVKGQYTVKMVGRVQEVSGSRRSDFSSTHQSCTTET
ncbi:hypothetical protein BCV70DRAFT_14883 [Testicularia cyperi]|uniref:Uncharacterized protein n=1 Tax=Testicularia cyperi TaxID=1882483 RepID=A0A317XYC5_9BASI|nr:hypothetical protein BCV70DRAFT_14883 [Testicularia cyperi]